jgi:hypothetical protein
MDETAWLDALCKGPIRRDANPAGIPYDVATRLMAKQHIEPAIERHGGLATMTWRTWRITDRGRATLQHMEAVDG